LGDESPMRVPLPAAGIIAATFEGFI
jgi:hypothetical protein